MKGRAVALPLLALLLVAAVLGLQIRNGGGDFVPSASGDPCSPRQVASVATGIDALSEEIVLLGLDGAACRLGVSRESLLLSIAQGQRPTGTVEAVRGGLEDAVDRLAREDRLPKASTLAGEAIELSDLPGFVKGALGALPDRLVDNQLDTGDVLRRAIGAIDVAQLLDNLDEPGLLQRSVQDAVIAAARDEIIDRVRNLF